MATLTPALDERPPGPASVARFGVTRGSTVEENARCGTAALRNADNIVASTSTVFVRQRHDDAMRDALGRSMDGRNVCQQFVRTALLLRTSGSLVRNLLARPS